APFQITCATSGSLCLQNHTIAESINGGTRTLMLPADIDGPAPPAGTPGYLLRTIAGGSSTDPQQDPMDSTDRIEIYRAEVDWDAQTWTVDLDVELPVADYRMMTCGGTRACVPQP